MRSPKMSMFALTCLIVTLALVSQPALAKGTLGEVSVHLEADSSWIEASQAINIRLTISNSGPEALGLLRWQTPVDGIEHDILQVSLDSEAVQYVGILAKRPAPTDSDYLMIAPGEEISMVFDPSAAYDMSARGSYSLRYAVIAEGRRISKSGQMERAPIKAISNELSLWIEGTPDLGYQKKRDEPAVLTEGSIAYESCTTENQTILQTAHANSTMISGLAVNHLASNPNGSSLYTTWFGTYTSSRFATVQDHFDAISDAFQNAPVTYNCKCRKPYFAYVYPSQPYRIYVCKVFWQVSDLGRDSRAGTLVHEMSHFYVVASTDDYVYGESGAKDLAITDPDKAIFNADNHEYFAEDQ